MKYENSVTLSLEEYLILRDQSIETKRLITDLLDACDKDSEVVWVVDILKIIEKHSSIYADRIEKIRKDHTEV